MNKYFMYLSYRILMNYKESEIATISIILTTICNIFICIIKIKYIEFFYMFIFLGLNIYIGEKKVFYKKEKTIYVLKKEIVKLNKILFLSTNILISFYVFKGPYFFLSKYKILILLGSIILGYFSLIFLQKIKIKLSLNLFKEIIKIFFISGLIYYLPIILFI